MAAVIAGIETGWGQDTVIGSASDDRIDTGGDQDRLVGGLGADVLTGGGGCDTFVFNALEEIGVLPGRQDIITDFVSQSDKIDLATIDANTLLEGNQAFVYVGAQVFSGLAGELRFVDQILSGDVNGDQVADFRLQLTGVLSLSASRDLVV
ncbi:MAG: M10 family metallopeptidase C-terminal domain-containing protein, partial [Cyanobacteriota bacterium]|nr:M10 family metallopeptidase C-terminal domain-containing protein [Cyanobacteriota bacterium]